MASELESELLRQRATQAALWKKEHGSLEGFAECWEGIKDEALIECAKIVEAREREAATPKPLPDPLVMNYGEMKKQGESTPQPEIEMIDGRPHSGGVQIFDYEKMRHPHRQFH